MFAMSFLVSTYWREAVFVPSIEAHDNNVHVLAKAINELIIHFKSLTSENNSEEEIVALLNAFVEMSSVILMRMARSKTDKTVKDLPSVVVFLDMVCWHVSIQFCFQFTNLLVTVHQGMPVVGAQWSRAILAIPVHSVNVARSVFDAQEVRWRTGSCILISNLDLLLQFYLIKQMTTTRELQVC